jgi:hypothetical protein
MEDAVMGKREAFEAMRELEAAVLQTYRAMAEQFEAEAEEHADTARLRSEPRSWEAGWHEGFAAGLSRVARELREVIDAATLGGE